MHNLISTHVIGLQNLWSWYQNVNSQNVHIQNAIQSLLYIILSILYSEVLDYLIIVCQGAPSTFQPPLQFCQSPIFLNDCLPPWWWTFWKLTLWNIKILGIDILDWTQLVDPPSRWDILYNKSCMDWVRCLLLVFLQGNCTLLSTFPEAFTTEPSVPLTYHKLKYQDSLGRCCRWKE